MRRTVTLNKNTMVFLFMIFGINRNMISADECNKESHPSAKFESVQKLLQERWSIKQVKFDKVHDVQFLQQVKDNSKYVIDYIFQHLKNEFDVASCIFLGIAQTKGIEEAVIYLHTTKYVFTSLRYTLNEYSDTNCFGKLERELTPFAIVLNSVLLHGGNKISETTFAGETFMCKDIKQLKKNEKIVFHTFMPSSTDVNVAIKYARKKKLFAAKGSEDNICLYMFYNTKVSVYRPRNIADLSYEPADAEAVYPIGAAFTKSVCKPEDVKKVKNEGANFIKSDMIMCLSLDAFEEKNQC